MDKFEVGKTYTTGERNDYVWRYTVISRTAKFITVIGDTMTDGAKRIGVLPNGATEYARPLGSYSQCPHIFANQTV